MDIHSKRTLGTRSPEVEITVPRRKPASLGHTATVVRRTLQGKIRLLSYSPTAFNPVDRD